MHTQRYCGAFYLQGTLSAWWEQGRPFASLPAMALPAAAVMVCMAEGTFGGRC